MAGIFWDLLCQIKSEINSLARGGGRGEHRSYCAWAEP